MYGSHKKHSAGARNVKARAKRALLLPSQSEHLPSLSRTKLYLVRHGNGTTYKLGITNSEFAPVVFQVFCS